MIKPIQATGSSQTGVWVLIRAISRVSMARGAWAVRVSVPCELDVPRGSRVLSRAATVLEWPAMLGEILDDLLTSPSTGPCITTLRHFPARAATLTPFPASLDPRLASALRA